MRAHGGMPRTAVLVVVALYMALSPVAGFQSTFSPLRVALPSRTVPRVLSTTTSTTTRSPTQLTTVSVPVWNKEEESPLSLFQTKLKQFGRSLQKNPIWQWRVVVTTCFASLWLARSHVDAQLVILWEYLLQSSALPARIFRTDSWEWCWAISCFGIFIHAFGLADKLVRRADAQGRIHPWKQYRLQDRYEADKRRRQRQRQRRSLLPQEGASVDKDDQDDDEADALLPVTHSKWHWQAWILEFWVYAAPLLVWDIVAPRRHRRIGGFGAPTTLGIVGGIAGGLLLYDILFFFGHVLMHKIPFLYRTIHAKHHESTEVRACDQVRLSIAEEVFDVGCSIVALNLLGVHPVARTLYNMVITFLLTELHCGFDFPWSPQNVVPFGFVTGSRRHHYHHRNGKHYYQKFFFTADRLFGLFQKNDGTKPNLLG